MKKKFLSFVLAVLLIIPCLFSLSACNFGGDNFNLLNEDFCFTIKGKTVTKDNFMKKTGGEGRWSTYYFSIDLNYLDLIQYDWSDENEDQVTDLDREGCIEIESFTYSGEYRFYANINHSYGSEMVEIKPGQKNKVDTTMGVDEYKRVMNIYVYKGDNTESENYQCTMLIIFADSTEIVDPTRAE